MELLQTIKLYFSQGIGILRIAYEHSPYDLESFGIVLPKAKEYAKLADALLGPADSPRLQHESIALAEQRQLSLDHLIMVNRHAKKLKQRGAAWKLRAELIAHEGSYKEVNAYGNRRVKEIQGEKPKEPGVKVSQAKNGMVTMTVTDTQRRITDFTKTLDSIETTEQPRKKALLEAFWKLIDSGGGLLQPEYRTVIAIGLDQSATIVRGEGNES
ncbi:MAG: HNH endonuclease, partial [Corynebacterium casei]|nr:HNH endonuclease [Corynebacterium casei]